MGKAKDKYYESNKEYDCVVESYMYIKELEKDKEDLIKKIEFLKRTEKHDYRNILIEGYNEAIEDVLELLK